MVCVMAIREAMVIIMGITITTTMEDMVIRIQLKDIILRMYDRAYLSTDILCIIDILPLSLITGLEPLNI